MCRCPQVHEGVVGRLQLAVPKLGSREGGQVCAHVLFRLANDYSEVLADDNFIKHLFVIARLPKVGINLLELSLNLLERVVFAHDHLLRLAIPAQVLSRFPP